MVSAMCSNDDGPMRCRTKSVGRRFPGPVFNTQANSTQRKRMRILLTLHHYLDADKGAAGVTLGLGTALAAAGCEVEYFAYDQAFGGAGDAGGVDYALQFPWRTAAFLKRHAHRFDVVDASTGDAWVWAAMGRPGAKRPSVLAVRSHGLEHSHDRAHRADVRRNKQKLGKKYPFYHGGYRLWEVAQSLRRADCCFLLNHNDQMFAHQKLGVPAARLTVLPNGIADTFQQEPPAFPGVGPLRLAFVGIWLPNKGIRAMTAAAARWVAAGLDFHLTLLGTGLDTAAVLADFAPAARRFVQVVPRYANRDLPALLAGQEVLLFVSLSEGFGLSLIEGMACGLAPVATPVGAAPEAVQSGINGTIIPLDSGEALAEAVLNMAGNRNQLLQMRRLAHETARRYRWSIIAAQTLSIYKAHLASQT